MVVYIKFFLLAALVGLIYGFLFVKGQRRKFMSKGGTLAHSFFSMARYVSLAIGLWYLYPYGVIVVLISVLSFEMFFWLVILKGSKAWL